MVQMSLSVGQEQRTEAERTCAPGGEGEGEMDWESGKVGLTHTDTAVGKTAS